MPKLYFRPNNLFTISIIGALFTAIIVSLDWPLRASIIIFLLGGFGLPLAIAQLILDLRRPPAQAEAKPTYEVRAFDDADPALASKGSLEMWAWLVGLVCFIPILGLPVTLTAFVFLYAKTYGAGWLLSLIMAASTAGFIYGLYVKLMDVYWPSSLLGDLTGFL